MTTLDEWEQQDTHVESWRWELVFVGLDVANRQTSQVLLPTGIDAVCILYFFQNMLGIQLASVQKGFEDWLAILAW